MLRNITAGLLLASLPALGAENYTWRNVAIGGGGFVTGVEFHPTERGLAYARTDVGGAYRWDETTARWTPLLDWLGQTDWNLQGVESLALDPTDADRVYLAVGTYSAPVPEIGNGAILRSTDRGNTWSRTPLPFKLGANEPGRGSGERLMVDPNFPSLIYFGTRRDGLWQSSDHGATWVRVPHFPDLPDDSAKHVQKPGGPYNPLAHAVGIAWVRLDRSAGKPGAPTPVIYIGISRTGESVFQSIDAGKTWSPLPNQPTAFRPTGAAIANDSTLYITYGDGPGPFNMGDGAVWKFAPAHATWTCITPEKPNIPTKTFGYAGICLDPHIPDSVFVSTWSRQPDPDEIYHSTNAGKTWRPIMPNATWDHSSAPYTATMKHHWLSDLEIDPFNRDRLVFNTGYGLWASTNLSSAEPADGRPVNWAFFNNGLEETVPLALISPPVGAHLISGVGDIDGFVHEDLSISPPNGRFSAPGYKNTEWLDYAALKPATIVRSGTTYRHDRIHAAMSDDSGITWSALATEPPHPNDPHPFTTGPVSISADGKTITWTPLGSAPFFTDDRGQTWRQSTLPPNVHIVGDRVEPKIFYAYDPAKGALHVSRDNGISFETTQTGLATPPTRQFGGPQYGDLAATPNCPGEAWLATSTLLYRFTDYGRKITLFPKLSHVGAIGFGKAAPGSNYPAIFITATLDGVHGIMRSDDAGVTWIRVTDASHQFGSASRLTGDPRVYGRVYFCTGGRGIIYGERTAETRDSRGGFSASRKLPD